MTDNGKLIKGAKNYLHTAYNDPGDREQFFSLLHSVELLLTVVENQKGWL